MEQSRPSHPANSPSGGRPSAPIGAAIPRWQIWVGWVLATAVGVALSFPSWEEIWGMASEIWGPFPAFRSQAILGLTMSIAQSLMLLRLGSLQRRSLIDLQWITATMAGMLLGGLATGIARITLFDPVHVLWGYEGGTVFWELSWPFLCGLSAGAFQQVILRQWNPLRWAVPSAIGWLAGFAVGALPTFVMPASDARRAFQVTGPAGTGIIVGIVMGAALAWLPTHPVRTDGGSPPDNGPASTPMT